MAAAPLAPWHGGDAPLHPIPALLPAAHAAHLVECSGAGLGDGNWHVRVSSIIYTSPDGVYFEGDTVGIRVNGTHVLAPYAVGWLRDHTFLELETGDTDRRARYANGHTSSAPILLNYSYTVQEGDLSTDLDYKSRNSLIWRESGSDNLHDVGGDPYDCRLPVPGEAGSLSAQGDIVVVGAEKAYSYARGATPDGTYGEGRTVRVAVEFDGPVSYSGDAPTLALNVSGTARTALYERGSGTDTFVFNYTVRSGDNTVDLGYNGTGALSGNVVNGTGHAVDLALPAVDTLSLLSDIALETVAPRVANVTARDGAYGAGRAVEISVRFDDNVTHSGAAPSLALNVGGLQRTALYDRGNGTDTLVFNYTVLAGDSAGDLDYAGTGALSGDIRDAAGNAANLTLPAPGAGGSLSNTSDVLLDHAAPQLIAAESARDNVGGFALDYAADVAAVAAGNHTYAVVAAFRDNSVQVIRVHGNGTLEPVDEVINSNDYGGMAGMYGVDTIRTGGVAYAFAVAATDDGLHMFRIYENGTITNATSPLFNNNDREFNGASRVAAFEMNGTAHALVAGFNDDGIQLVRFNGSSLEAGNSLRHSGDLPLDEPLGMDVFDMGNEKHALATALSSDRVHLIRIGEDGTLLVPGTLVNAPGRQLDGPIDVAAFDLNGTVHALVASTYGHGVQLIRVNGDGTLEAAGSANGSSSGFAGFTSTSGVSVVSAGGTAAGVYALVVSHSSGGTAQLVHVRGGDGALLSAGSVVGGSAGFAGLRTPYAVSTFDLGGAAHALAVSNNDYAQLIRLSATSVANVTASGAGGMHGLGENIDIRVAFDGNVSVAEPLELRLNTGGAAAYHSGNGSDTLVFRYAAAPGERSTDALDYAGVHALRAGPGGSITEAGGPPGRVIHASALLPPPGSPDSLGGSRAIAIDARPPVVESVSSPNASGAYGAGRTILVNVTFDEPVEVSGAPRIALDAGGTGGAAAEYASGSGGTSLLFAYTVRAGDSAPGLRYASETALSPAGSIRDLAGNAADLGLPAPGPLPGTGDIVLDTAAPRVANVTSATPDGKHGTGARILVSVNFDEPVWHSGGAPGLRLDVGGSPRNASYASGSGTQSLVFGYTVMSGDRADDLDYYGAGALSGDIADAAGNAANRTLPPPGSPLSLSGTSALRLDGSRPSSANASAVFTGPNTVRIDYTAPLGPPEGHTGSVYGGVSVAGGAEAPASSESGLGTQVHTVRFGGGGAGASQNGSIRLLADLAGEAGGVGYEFTADSIAVAAGTTALTLSPPGAAPVVAIESGGFVRALNATAAGDTARPAINLAGLPSNGTSATLPAERVAVIASFAEVSFPPGANVTSVPADGLLELYVSARAPTAQEVARGFGVDAADILEVRRVVEIGDNATRIAFDLPVRILLVGQANGSAFYAGGADGAVVPISRGCGADDTAAAHALLNGTGECQIDSADGEDKIIYTYHLTRFGTARVAPGDTCAATLSPPEMQLGEIEPGGRFAAPAQEVRGNGTLPLASVSVSAAAWTGAGGAVVMPASATSVMAGGAAGAAAAWTPLGGGEPVALSMNGGSASAEFRVDVPRDALPAGATSPVKASQALTYTVTCDAPQG